MVGRGGRGTTGALDGGREEFTIVSFSERIEFISDLVRYRIDFLCGSFLLWFVAPAL